MKWFLWSPHGGYSSSSEVPWGSTVNKKTYFQMLLGQVLHFGRNASGFLQKQQMILFKHILEYSNA